MQAHLHLWYTMYRLWCTSLVSASSNVDPAQFVKAATACEVDIASGNVSKLAASKWSFGLMPESTRTQSIPWMEAGYSSSAFCKKLIGVRPKCLPR